MNVVKSLLGFDGRECLCEEVGHIVVGWRVGQVKQISVFDVVAEPVMAHVDVPCAVLIDRVLKEGERSLIIAVEADWLGGMLRTGQISSSSCLNQQKS